MTALAYNLSVSVGCLLAQAGPAASPAGLPIGPWKLVFLLGWFYLCLFLVKQVEDNPLVPDQYKSLLYGVTLLAGPVVFLALVLIDTKRNAAPGNFVSSMVERAKAAVAGIWSRRRSAEAAQPTLRLYDSMGTELNEIYGHGGKKSGDRNVLDLTVRMIENALQLRASDILIDPQNATSYAVRLRIDGTLRTLRELPSETCKAVINSVKAVSSMDISERRRPQDGAFSARGPDVNVSFRVASAGAMNGEKLSIRVLNQNAARYTMADAGITEEQRAVIEEAINQPSGMVLMCGPTGSGKTTTLYAMLNKIDRSTHNVITVEDPIESHLPGISQLEINAKADITFAKALRSILRQDPDVICVGEIRDEETAEIALRAAQTGHLVLATIHCDSNATALIRLLDLGVSRLLMASGLSLLVSQRLLRKLCPHCRRPAQLPATIIDGLRQKGLDTRHLYEAVGCDHCGGTGYYGRTAICDILHIDDDLRTEIAHSEEIATRLRTEAETAGKSNLKSEGLMRVVSGITSLEELKRVVG